MTATCEERRDETLLRVMVENPTLTCNECERIAAAIVRDREMRTSPSAARIRGLSEMRGNEIADAFGER